MPKAVVILQDDPARAQNLASQIRSISDVVFIAQSLAELQTMASQFPIPIGESVIPAISDFTFPKG
jgi:hypothetical protein